MMQKIHRWAAFGGSSGGPEAKDQSESVNNQQPLMIEGADTSKKKEEEIDERGGWKGQADFLMSLIAYAVGLGNVWRFPYLCFKNGGGAFLVPYFICWTLAAVPIFFLEVSLGQFLQRGGITVWKICPIFKGVGIANVLISSFCNIYYCVIVAWALYYLFASFAETLPWEDCNNPWNDERCVVIKNVAHPNFTSNRTFAANLSLQTPVEQFWERRVLQTSGGIDEGTSEIQWELAGLLLLAWIVVYFALWKGITNSRKFVYFCAMSPYLLLGTLFIRGVTLPGASEGITYYLWPRVDALFSTTVWKDAGTQVFYSYGIGFGVLVSLGSYNSFHHNVYRDALMLCTVNVFTSLLAGFVVFSVLGFMALEAGKTVDEVVKSGVGLAFLVYPEAVVNLPVKQLWSCLFFAMIAILGMDSQVCTVEGVVTALSDAFPDMLRKGHRKKIFVGVLCICNFLLALPMVSKAGQYWLTLVDAYGASGIVILFVVFFEVVGYAWGFGAKRVYKALDEMIGFKPCRYWAFCWQYTAPIICFILFFFVLVKYEPLMYATGVPYPGWAEGLGFMMSTISMLAIPAYAAYYVYRCPTGSILERIKRGLKPGMSLPYNGHNNTNTSNNKNGTGTEMVERTKQRPSVGAASSLLPNPPSAPPSSANNHQPSSPPPPYSPSS